MRNKDLLQKKEALFLSCIIEVFLVQASINFYGTRDQFHGRRIFAQPGEGWFEDASRELHLFSVLYFYYHDISSISDHQDVKIPEVTGPLA